MAKLTDPTIMKLVNEATSSEISHIVTSTQYQEHDGTVDGGIDRSIFKVEGRMAISTHYNCLKTLQNKGFYAIDPTGDIKIISNNFLGETGELDFRTNNYVELPNFVHSSKFHNASVQVKRLVLFFLHCGTKYEYKKVNIKTLMNILNLNRPAKVKYAIWELDSLNWFNISDGDPKHPGRQVLIKVKRECTGTSRFKHNRKSENKVRNIFKDMRIEYTPKVLKDFTQLLNQYKENFLKCLQYLNQNTANGKIFRTIICKAIAFKVID